VRINALDYKKLLPSPSNKIRYGDKRREKRLTLDEGIVLKDEVANIMQFIVLKGYGKGVSANRFITTQTNDI
jgi:hypothetical protein